VIGAIVGASVFALAKTGLLKAKNNYLGIKMKMITRHWAGTLSRRWKGGIFTCSRAWSISNYSNGFTLSLSYCWTSTRTESRWTEGWAWSK
jgi:hypothetical protein